MLQIWVIEKLDLKVKQIQNDLREAYQARPQSAGHEIWMILEVKLREDPDQKPDE